MKNLYLTLILLLILNTAAYANRPTTYKNSDIRKLTETVIKDKISKEVQKNTVSVFGVGEGVGFCSGVIVAATEKRTYVVTCKHCVGPTEETLIENKQADAIFTTMDEDLALIIVNGTIPKKYPAKLAKKNSKFNEKLIHIGYPVFKLYESWGNLLRTTKDWHWASFKSKGGCSGGGVFNTKKELVGILWGNLHSDDISIYEPIEDIHRFLKKTKVYIK